MNKLRGVIAHGGTTNMKTLYLKYAKFCCDHGIKPVLSPKASTVERSWQDQLTPQRNSSLYIEKDESIELMFQDVLPYLPKDAQILEIGCNAGRNLDYLYQKGYRNLTGIEIGVRGCKNMQKAFPDAYRSTRYITGSATLVLPKMCSNHYDLIFTHSVLINIPYCHNSVFSEIARISKGYILTMENEGNHRAYPRNFEKVFRRVGCEQILYKLFRYQDGKRTLPVDFRKSDILKNNTLRVFVKWNNT